MENLNVREGNKSQLYGASWQYFNKREYEERNLEIKKKGAEAKKEDEVKRNKLMYRLLGDTPNQLSMSETWGLIDWYLQEFQNDPDFPLIADMFSSNKKIDHESLQWNTLTEIIKSEDRLPEPLIYQAAALLLANCEKWYSPYRWLSMYENSWLWVKVLFGKDYYDQFMVDKKNCIDDIQSGSWVDRNALQDVLSTCEMDYIINNIRWSNWKMKYFWFHDNLSWSLLSNEFADRLSSLVKWWFNRSSVIERYEKTMHNDFDLAKNDFERYIKSSRFSWALANLGRMLSLSRNAEQKSESQKCFLVCMLSWVLDIYGQNDIKKQVYQWGKTLWFLPWMLVKNTWHSEQVAELLDDFSNWDFSNHVKSFFHKNDLLKWEIKIWNLIEEVNKWWSIDKMYKFEQYSKFAFFTKSFPLGSSLEQLQKLASNNGVDSSLYS